MSRKFPLENGLPYWRHFTVEELHSATQEILDDYVLELCNDIRYTVFAELSENGNEMYFLTNDGLLLCNGWRKRLQDFCEKYHPDDECNLDYLFERE